MPDDFKRQRSEKAIALYTKFRAQLDATPPGGRWMSYNWWHLPERMHIVWMPYCQMLREYATELANIINALTHHVHRLQAWATIIASLPEDDKLEAAQEFLDVIGIVALGQPYAIKSRFAFAAGHLCHQANRAKDVFGWSDKFPSGNLYLNHIDLYGAHWQKFRPFKLLVEPLAGSLFKEKTQDFRNAYNHRFSSHFVLGMTAIVSRTETTEGKVEYGFGGKEPLDLVEIADLLDKERRLCYRAFDAFQELIYEQITFIKACEAYEMHQRP